MKINTEYAQKALVLTEKELNEKFHANYHLQVAFREIEEITIYTDKEPKHEKTGTQYSIKIISESYLTPLIVQDFAQERFKAIYCEQLKTRKQVFTCKNLL